MSKTPCGLWNVIATDNSDRWMELPDTNGKVLSVTLAEDSQTGHYTRLTRFLPGADTSAYATQSHSYVEEIYIIEGEIYDAVFDRTLVAGDYTCRPPHEDHGPFKSPKGCLVMEISYPDEPPEKV